MYRLTRNELRIIEQTRQQGAESAPESAKECGEQRTRVWPFVALALIFILFVVAAKIIFSLFIFAFFMQR